MSVDALSAKQCQKMLEQCYQEATKKNGLIDFTENIRSNKYSLKRSDLISLFSKKVWVDIKTKSGHRKLINKITGCVIEYSNHCKDINPTSATAILNAVQNHLNILRDEIFAYKMKSWKEKPDYQASVERFFISR